ncbi:hypothetical protein ACVIHI_000502 [Bradyrhizobium sp. USDA 4524]|uniref:hypothetical protein n=1 Tax=unclassified Bradyrhizobium TaxID=2631580 RepID=UPI00209F2260|nr:MULTISPECIES: hypothetical protein [unclassified Bradyrhizobium]MCP1838127.1 hypothetical protein [Bradyrhizobium sp. USDA 4538]MCP1898692.1 hypothetical protein [Bradyrhizobium sp. USDA 4537]MCP1909191.1 hypothetical protein [Bradyrhizobium elkanii]MCP1987197.1 hypothetical protein [Bradyrhizobium sp. USDA 4539]
MNAKFVFEEVNMATRAVPHAFFSWSWSPVLAGVFASLVIQILLTMLGFGIGLLAIDTPTAASAPASAGWPAFVWWAVSGIIAAFVGGAIAAANSPDQSGLGRVGHALGAWAVATVIVVAAAAMIPASAASIAGNLAGPSYAANARIAYYSNNPARETVGSTSRPGTQAQMEEARKHLAYTMLASFCALLLGAGAAYAAGMATTARAVEDATRPVT